VNSLSSGLTIGQFHNDDGTFGGSTSPPYEQDLQPNDNMSIYIGNLTASAAPSDHDLRARGPDAGSDRHLLNQKIGHVGTTTIIQSLIRANIALEASVASYPLPQVTAC
jgi:hypothetical protein